MKSHFTDRYYQQYAMRETDRQKGRSMVSYLSVDEFMEAFEEYRRSNRQSDEYLRELFEAMLRDTEALKQHEVNRNQKRGKTLGQERMEIFRQNPDPEFQHYQGLNGRSPLWEFEQKLEAFWATGDVSRIGDLPQDWDSEAEYEKFITLCGSKAEATRIRSSALLYMG
jgi:hypothetical protein